MATKDEKFDQKAHDKAHARSAENYSVPTEESRDLWQSATVATDGPGPRVEDVAGVFARARADALENPVTADDDDEALADEQEDAAADAREEADTFNDRGGYAAPTGADAGVYDDADMKGNVPAKNFNAEPKPDRAERTDARTDEKSDSKSTSKSDSKTESKSSTARKSDSK